MNQATMTAASTTPLEGPPGDCDVALDGLSAATARALSFSPRNKEVVHQSCCYCGLNQHTAVYCAQLATRFVMLVKTWSLFAGMSNQVL